MLEQTAMQDIFCWFKDSLFDTTIYSMLNCIVPDFHSSYFIFKIQTGSLSAINFISPVDYGKCGHVMCFSNVLIGQSVILCDVSGSCDQY